MQPMIIGYEHWCIHTFARLPLGIHLPLAHAQTEQLQEQRHQPSSATSPAAPAQQQQQQQSALGARAVWLQQVGLHQKLGVLSQAAAWNRWQDDG